MSIEVHAHRGDRSNFPENTLAAFEAALELGADFIELDVHVSADQELVVYHDAWLNNRRVEGWSGEPKPILSCRAEELRQYDVGAIADPNFPNQKSVPGQRIEKLSDMFDRFESESIGLNIELKSIPALNECYPRLDDYVGVVAKFLESRNIDWEKTMIQSYDHLLIEGLTKKFPRGRFVATFGENRMDYLSAARRVGVRGVNLMLGRYDQKDIERLTQTGIEVLTYTSNRKLEWDRLKVFGFSGIVSDVPGDLISYLS